MIAKNINSYVKIVPATKATALTAAGTGDNTEITGPAIDTTGYGSLVYSLGGVATIAANKAINATVKYETSDNASTWNTAVVLANAVEWAEGLTTADILEPLQFELTASDKPKYIRFKTTPDLTATGTDTAIVYGDVLLGGAQVLPTS
jgi:predicted phage tail protein